MAKITSTSVADGIPFDPELPTLDPSSGYVLTYNGTTKLWEAKPIGSNSLGVVPPFVFSKDGNCSVGTYLRTGVVVSSKTGQLIKGNNKIVEIQVSNINNVSSVTRVQFHYRTGRLTRLDIADAYVEIPVGDYKGKRSGLSIDIGPDWEIGCRNSSGSTLNEVSVVLYVVPA